LSIQPRLIHADFVCVYETRLSRHLSLLVMYALCALALLRLQCTGRLRGARRGSAALAGIGICAALYSLWAIAGAGAVPVALGALLLAIGVPLYYGGPIYRRFTMRSRLS
jgi:hypothetical protein